MIATRDGRAVACAAALAFALIFIIDCFLVPSGPGIGDEAEAQTVPYILGIAHPTGFPAYVLTGWLWSHIVAVGTVAWRLNAFMAFLTALTASGVVMLAVAIGADRLAAVLAALVFAFGNWVWMGALHANAQPLSGTLSLFTLLACVWFAKSGDRRAFVAACGLNGLALATHPAAIFIVPAIAVAMAWRWRALNIPLLLAGAAALIVPLTLYAYVPLRALTIGAGDPTGGAPLFGNGSIAWSMQSGRTLDGFLDEVLGRREGAGGSLRAVANYALVWNAIGAWMTLLLRQFNILTVILAAIGAVVLAARNLRALTILVAGTLGGVIFAYIYRTDMHLDRYVFISFAIVAVLAATVSHVRLPGIPARSTAIVATLALAGLAVRAVAINHDPITPSAISDGTWIVAAIARDTPDDAIVLAQWNDAAALAYGAYAAHTLGTRLIVGVWPGELAYLYPEWAAQRPLFILESPIARVDLSELPPWITIRRRTSSLDNYVLYEVESPLKNLRR